MSIFTSEQLEFLASLKTGWGGLIGANSRVS